MAGALRPRMPAPRPGKSNRLPRALRWAAAPVALAALVWAIGFRESASARPAGVAAEAAAGGPTGFAASALGPAAFANLSKAARESAARETARFVAEKNREAEKDRKAFAADGWERVEVAPPDARLVALDPQLVDGREEELRAQIASTT